ncbi:MAG: hypothetical protein RRY99_13030 [Flavobacterium sp.]
MTIEFTKLILKEKWKINPYDFWIPLKGKVENNTCYFEIEDFKNNFGYKKLNEILERINIGNIYSFNEVKEEKIINEINLSDYNFLDIFYTNENADWVIYQTHEGTISFAGKELIENIKLFWKNWEEKINPWEK